MVLEKRGMDILSGETTQSKVVFFPVENGST